MIQPGASSVVTFTAQGTQPRHLGAIGHVDHLSYSYVNPGGCDQLSCVLHLPPVQRPDAVNPGRIVQVFRGGSVVWDGKLLEPAPAADGWTLTADGVGRQGADFAAYYATNAWGSVAMANEVIDRAITRGLRWTRPSAIPAGVWFGQPADPASQQVDAFLNLLCTKGGFTWYVTTGGGTSPGYAAPGNALSVYALPATTAATATRVLVSSTPAARTLGGDVNSLWLRYQSSNPGGAAAPAYATANVTTAASVTAHQAIEAYDDLSSSGFQALGTVQAAGNAVLNRYQRASFSTGFTIRYGELLTTGGYPVDLGTDHCGQVVKLILADFGYGGEVVPGPLYFMIGGYAYDDASQTAHVVPFQGLALSMSGLLSALATTFPRRPVPHGRHPATIRFRHPHWRRHPSPTSDWPGGRQPPPFPPPRVIPGGPMR